MSTQNLRRITYSVILAITFYLLMIIGGNLYTLVKNILRSHTNAPGAQTAPHLSQVGKVDLPDRGGLICSEVFFEHYAFSQSWNAAKLIPISRQSVQIHTNGQILFGSHALVVAILNIIYIIAQFFSHAVAVMQYNIWLELCIIHPQTTINQAEGICLKSGVSPGFGLFIALVAPCDRTECTSA